jgi:hypothetical protein
LLSRSSEENDGTDEMMLMCHDPFQDLNLSTFLLLREAKVLKDRDKDIKVERARNS